MPEAQFTDISLAHLITIILVFVAVCLRTLEDSLNFSLFQPGRLLDWRFALACSTVPISLDSRLNAILFGRRAVGVVYALRLASLGAALLATYEGAVALSFILSFICFGCHLYILYRAAFMMDGADQMLLILLAGSTVMTFHPWRVEFGLMGAAFITAQLVLAYLTTGLAKLMSRDWRSGLAFTQIMSTVLFGNDYVLRRLKGHPARARVLSWVIILSQLLLGVSILIGGEWVAIAVVISVFFHVGVAVIMRLSQFTFVFAAALPSALLMGNWELRNDLFRAVLG
jgi:hypothetical protein